MLLITQSEITTGQLLENFSGKNMERVGIRKFFFNFWICGKLFRVKKTWKNRPNPTLFIHPVVISRKGFTESGDQVLRTCILSSRSSSHFCFRNSIVCKLNKLLGLPRVLNSSTNKHRCKIENTRNIKIGKNSAHFDKQMEYSAL
jgi:hypothetical protein